MKIEWLNVTYYSTQEIFQLIWDANLGMIFGIVGSIFMIILSLLCVIYLIPYTKISLEKKQADNLKKLKRASLQKILVQKEIEEEVEKEIEEDTKKMLEKKNK